MQIHDPGSGGCGCGCGWEWGCGCGWPHKKISKSHPKRFLNQCLGLSISGTKYRILSNADSDFLKSLSARVILIDFGHVAKIFKRPKNREDSSDFDDFWTEMIVMT